MKNESVWISISHAARDPPARFRGIHVGPGRALNCPQTTRSSWPGGGAVVAVAGGYFHAIKDRRELKATPSLTLLAQASIKKFHVRRR